LAAAISRNNCGGQLYDLIVVKVSLHPFIEFGCHYARGGDGLGVG
jgi:hypothetical protein